MTIPFEKLEACLLPTGRSGPNLTRSLPSLRFPPRCPELACGPATPSGGSRRTIAERWFGETGWRSLF
jgi:hypothetical protein